MPEKTPPASTLSGEAPLTSWAMRPKSTVPKRASRAKTPDEEAEVADAVHHEGLAPAKAFCWSVYQKPMSR